MKYFFMALLFLLADADAKIPEWAARNSTKLNGQILSTVCHGTGPSLDIARVDALKSCQSNASQYFKSKIRIKSLSVETEKSVGFHQEVMNDDEIDGLSCDPQRDETSETDSQFSVWIECKFDLQKVNVSPTKSTDAVANTGLNRLESSKIDVTPDIQAKHIFISTVPKCESAIVRGVASRTIQCSQNPLKIQINDTDDEILIRANGYRPKSIKLKGVNSNETIQVLLDLL